MTIDEMVRQMIREDMAHVHNDLPELNDFDVLLNIIDCEAPIEETIKPSIFLRRQAD